MPQSPDIGQNSDGGISNFRISGQSLIKQNCHNSRTSDDIDMNFGTKAKLDKRNKTTSKKFDDYVMSANCDRGSEYDSGYEYVCFFLYKKKKMNMLWFWIYQGSKYATVKQGSEYP